MSFDSISSLLAMGGHGLYVWLSYGVSLVVVLANVFSVRVAQRRQIGMLRDRERRKGATEPTDPVTESS